ncbi:MAG: energy transducer TonB, partial [Myxococcota bacterium]
IGTVQPSVKSKTYTPMTAIAPAQPEPPREILHATMPKPPRFPPVVNSGPITVNIDLPPTKKTKFEQPVPLEQISIGVPEDLTTYTSQQSSVEAPLFRVEPIYPRRAAEQFIEGWVTVQFDISAAGTTENVRIVEAEPRRIFDRAARNAVRKWRYRPLVRDGQPRRVTGLTVRLTFNLE